MVQTIDRRDFGDVVFRDALGGEFAVVTAPRFTRIPLASFASPLLRVDVDRHVLVLCGHVDYQVLDVDPWEMTVVCQLTDDRRPLMVQVEDRAEQARRRIGGGQ